MANHHPVLENLEKGRGKKSKLGHQPFTMNLLPSRKNNLEKIALSFDCKHGNKGSISQLLSRIADGELIIVKNPPTWKSDHLCNGSTVYRDNVEETIDDEIYSEIKIGS
jgi:hypothetical protein